MNSESLVISIICTILALILFCLLAFNRATNKMTLEGRVAELERKVKTLEMEIANERQ